MSGRIDFNDLWVDDVVSQKDFESFYDDLPEGGCILIEDNFKLDDPSNLPYMEDGTIITLIPSDYSEELVLQKCGKVWFVI